MPYRAEWDGPVAGYSVNFVAKNYWRVARTMERDDAMQEARYVFLKVRARYPEVEEGAHFMALFKTSLARRFHNLAAADTEDRVTVPLPEDRDELPRDRVGELECDGYLATLVRQAPAEVRMVLSLFLGAPQELLEAALAEWHEGGNRGMLNGGSGAVNRLLGLPAEQDTMRRVRDYFAP